MGYFSSLAVELGFKNVGLRTSSVTRTRSAGHFAVTHECLLLAGRAAQAVNGANGQVLAFCQVGGVAPSLRYYTRLLYIL